MTQQKLADKLMISSYKTISKCCMPDISLLPKISYESDLRILLYKMLSGSADVEECGNKIKNVWLTLFGKKVILTLTNIRRKTMTLMILYQHYFQTLTL